MNNIGLRASFLTAVIILLHLNIRSQNLSIRNFTKDDGLSVNYITCIHQDKRGFIWMGSFFGLNRFDGTAFTTYLPNQRDYFSLHANHIHHIAEGNNGLLWLSTDRGLITFDPITNRSLNISEQIPEIENTEVKKCIIDTDEKIWFYTKKDSNIIIYCLEPNHQRLLNNIRKSSKETKEMKLDSIKLDTRIFKELNLFYPLNDNQFLLANSEGLFYTLQLKERKLLPASREKISTPFGNSGSGVIWSQKLNKGIILSPDYNFNNIYTLDQMSEVIPYKGNTFVEFGFYRENVRLLEKTSAGNFREKNPAFVTTTYPTTFSRLVDHAGNVWLGTIGYGIYKISEVKEFYNRIAPEIKFYNAQYLWDGSIWPGYLDQDKIVSPGNYRIAETPWKSLLPFKAEVKNVLHNPKNNKTYILALHSGNKIYLAAYNHVNKTLDVISENFWHAAQSPHAMIEDRDGNIWIYGYNGELSRYSPQLKTFQKWDLGSYFPSSIADKLVPRDIKQLENGELWLANNYGLIQFKINVNNQNPDVTVYHNYQGKEKLFSNNGIFSIAVDLEQKHILWLGTLGEGLACFDTKSGKIQYYPYLSEDPIYYAGSLIQDNDGNIWFASNRGIKCFSTKTRQFFIFKGQRNLEVDNISMTNTSLKKGESLLFSSGNGLLSINPKTLLEKDDKGLIQIYDVRINGMPLFQLYEDAFDMIDASTEKITLDLKHDQNNISFRFSKPLALFPDDVNFRYRIKEISEDWYIIGKEQKIVLNGVAPGNYVLEIQSLTTSANEDVNHTMFMTVCIRPPWYASTPAYTIYFFLLLGLVIGVFKYERKRLVLQHQYELQKEEAGKQRALNNFINRFFSFVAHEFKTPLSIIMGVYDELKHDVKLEKNMELLDSAKKEGFHILDMIDEMIDMTKLNNDTFKLSPTSGNIGIYIQSIADSFKPLANIHQINLQTDEVQMDITASFDHRRLRYVMNNLLSNALRFTPKNGWIRLKVSRTIDEQLLISVQDSGQGIASETITHIFKPDFTTSPDNGKDDLRHFGLGLAFVKEIVQKMGGTLGVESMPGEGALFSIFLPLQSDQIGNSNQHHDEAFEDVSTASAALLNVNAAQFQNDLPVLLVVDDNPLAIQNIARMVDGVFNVISAKNGDDAYLEAKLTSPDIIITDVVMPVMDGLELTSKLKTDPLTNHIPVVIISGKGDLDDRLKGQTVGADIYMLKPVVKDELIVTLKNLHGLQAVWKEKFNQKRGAENTLDKSDSNGYINTAAFNHQDHEEDVFLTQLKQIFEEHYPQENFDTDQLCKILHMSRAQLYRKLTAISDQGAMELLRNFRLEKGLSLLKENQDLSTKEVAFKVGFKERSHFSNLFSKKYGFAPSDMKKRNEYLM